MKEEFKNYITMAKTGHYPLFNIEWFEKSASMQNPLSYKAATNNVESIFKNLARHKSLSKKQTAVLAMSTETREEFIRSFFKMVEHETLRDIEQLQ